MKPASLRVLFFLGILLISHSGFASDDPKSFDQLWKEIDSAVDKSLPKTALQTLDIVYDKAKTEKNDPQLLKSILFRFKLFEMSEEDHLQLSIDYAKSQFDFLKSPSKQWLHSILAELYIFYYQQHRYEWLERTNLVNNDSEDMNEWDLGKLQTVIKMHYEASVEETSLLKAFSLSVYKDILENTAEESLTIQPTVYDFLVQRLIAYYLSTDAGIQKPVASQEFNDARAWARGANFIKVKFADSENPKVKALQLFQQLIQFHIGDKNPEAYFYCELQRFELVRNLMSKQKDTNINYLKVLETMQLEKIQYAVSTEAAALRARFLLDQPYNPEFILDSAIRWNANKALKICEDAIAQFPESRGAKSCELIKQQILKKTLNLEIQNVELPNKPIAFRAEFQNITNIHFRLAKISQSLMEQLFDGNKDRQSEEILKLIPEFSWNIRVPFENDYHAHSTILNLPKLETGLWILLASPDSSFSNGNLIEIAQFQVSRLSYIHSRTDDKNVFYLLDRETGKPIKNIVVHIKSRNYEYHTRTYTKEFLGKLTTSNEGKFVIDRAIINENRSFSIEIESARDTLYSGNYFSTYSYKQDRDKHIQTYFFTDRAIYRPGQIVFFKGIVLESEGANKEIKANHDEEITFYDANYQKISSIKLMTNDFGSFEGSFSIPTGLLNGSMRLQSEHGSVSFNVEEYKRPTFEVKVEAPDKQFTLNEMVTLKGKAMTFAGFGLDSVVFTYKVERGQQFPYWRYCWGWPPFGDEKTIITNGESFTKKDGSFNVDFRLIPDENSNQNFNPVYVYTITVDVTDRNGETRTGIFTLSASSNALIINSNAEGEINNSKLDEYTISTSNLQGRGVKATVAVAFYSLISDSFTRTNQFQPVDRQLLSDKELKKYFPLDDFYRSSEVEKRQKKLVYSKAVEVDSLGKLFPSEAQKWVQGAYYVVLSSKDNYGNDVKIVKEFNLFDEFSDEVSVKTMDWAFVSSNTAEPDDTVTFQFGSVAKNCKVLVQLSSGERIIRSEWMNVSDGRIKIPYAVKETDRGGLQCEFTSIRYNRLVDKVLNVNIPFTNKMLDVQLKTKRERLTPGANEKWTISVKSKIGETLQSELLATMYDASLDQFVTHGLYFSVLPGVSQISGWSFDEGFGRVSSFSLYYLDTNPYYPQPIVNPTLNWFGLSQFNRNFGRPYFMADGAMKGSVKFTAPVIKEDAELVLAEGIAIEKTAQENTKVQEDIKSLRTNFNETAFFYPQLRTDNEGNVSFSFHLPDALTKWKLMLLAYTKDLKTGTAEYTFTASKDVMIMPNLPRFYREGDTAFVQAKIVNTGKETISGTAKLEISDAVSENEITSYFMDNQSQNFEKIEPGQSKNVRWKIAIGNCSNMITMKFSATAGTFTDGEQHQIPVLPQKTLVTESLVLNTKPNSKQIFTFKPLNSKDVKQTERLEIQLCSNPSWYAIQALPYLVDNDFENAESIYNRFYANTLASIVAEQIPGAMKVIEQWKSQNPNELLSNLEKNQNLKSILLQETPWVMEAKDETDQKNRISLLFDINRMQYEVSKAMKQLKQLQTVNGAWTWFPGMPESDYITNRIVAGLGKLSTLKAGFTDENEIDVMISSAIGFLDENLRHDYEKLLVNKQETKYTLQLDHLNYLYARSFFSDKAINETTQPAFEFILKHLETDWKSFDKGMQAMAAVALDRFGKQSAAKAIIASLLQHAIVNKELGMYWKSSTSYRWYEAPIESQALIINAFEEIEGKSADIDLMRTWLLSQKQTNRWKTNSATAEAIYALLFRGSDWINTSKPVEIKVGKNIIENKDVNENSPMFTKVWKTTEITPEMSVIEVNNPNKSMSWGGAFRQYFIDIDKVTESKTQLQLSKELFIERIGKDGKELVSVNDQQITIGNKIIVRIVLTTDRDMEFVHLKDQRAASFEPVNVISGYEYKGGLGYYQTTKDASMDFFFDYLQKGKYVFEYELIASQIGEFSNGRARIECYYAPEFSSHSSGLRVRVLE